MLIENKQEEEEDIISIEVLEIEEEMKIEGKTTDIKDTETGMMTDMEIGIEIETDLEEDVD